jgi:hypothetical protein
MSRITSGEIGAALARIEAHQEAISERVGRIEAKIDAAPTMRDLEPFHARVKALEATQTWVVRSIVGAVVTGLVALLFAVGSRFRLGAVAAIAGFALMVAGARADGHEPGAISARRPPSPPRTAPRE